MVLPDGLSTPLLFHYLVLGLTLTSTPLDFVQSYQIIMKLPAAAYSAEVATSATKAGSCGVFGEGESKLVPERPHGEARYSS
jgi:hypothetical protein